MKYLATKYNEKITIEADYFRLVHGHKEITSGGYLSGGGTNVYDWQDAVFFRNGEENPVAFVQQPYSVTEVESANVEAK